MSKFLIKSAFWLTLSEIIFNISGYIVHSGVARVLGPSDYGRYGLVVTLTTMIIVLIGRGIPTAMTKYISEIYDTKPEMIRAIKRKAALSQTILIGSITVLFFLLSPFIARALQDSTLTPLFRISSLIIPAFAVGAFYVQYYVGLHRFGFQALLKTIRSISKIIFIIGLALLFKLEGSVAGYIAAPLFVFLVAGIYDHFVISKTLPEGKQTFEWKKLVDYAWPVTLFMIFYEILVTIDLYFVKGLLQNDFLTGVYNGALTLARIPYFLFYALTIILLPVISKSSSGNNLDETKKIIKQTLRIMTILLAPAVVLMFVYAKPIVYIFFGSEYIGSVFPMQILVFGVGFLTIFYVLSFAMNGAGKVRVPMFISLFGALLNIALSYFMIKEFGLLGAAIATSVTSAVIMAIMLFFVQKNFQALLELVTFLKIVFASAFVYFASYYFPGGSYIFILWSVILLAIYFTALYILKEIKQEDILLFKRLVKRKSD